MSEGVTLTFLGGLGEIGRNCACIEQDGRVVILDCGVMFPEPDMPGIDLVLPDLTYLFERAKSVEAVILSHGHEDHTGGVPYLLRELNAPVYGSDLSLALVHEKLREAGLAKRARLIEVADGDRIRVGPFDVEFIPVAHSVPRGFATAFHTSEGVVLHSGDFKLDMAPIDGRTTDLARIGALAAGEGVRLLLSDSTNADEPGFTDSESSVGVALRQVMAEHRGSRVIVASFASHIHRIQQVVTAARGGGRRIAALGRSMERNITVARSLGALDLTEGDLVSIEEVPLLDPGTVCVLCTGSQGEPMSALALLANGENRFLKIADGDVVVLSSHPIPGNEWFVGKVINGLARRGAQVVHTGVEKVHVSGHAKAGELMTLLSVARPEFFVPVHGELRHLAAHARLAERMGVARRNVSIVEDGARLHLQGDEIKPAGKASSSFLYVDGTVGDVGHGVLRDRRLLAQEGVVMAVVVVDLHAGEVVGEPEIITHGWVHADEAGDLLDDAREAVRRSVELAIREGAVEHETFRKHVRRALGRLVNERTRRRPLIVPVVVVV